MTLSRGRALLFAVFGAVVVARIVAVFTENVNWDEFALLHRAVLNARSGEFSGGGRPGLGTLVLTPLAAECRNAIDTLVHARLFWVVMVVASAAALWYVLREVLPERHRFMAVATGVGMWVLAPPFVRYSMQVRTDQPAILFGLLGGLVLLRSRHRASWALLAGALFGVGFLFSQKLVYVGALMALLAAGQLLVLGVWRPRREAVRVAFTAVAFVVVVLGYRELMRQLAGSSPAMLNMPGSLNVFEYYREFYGWRLYGQMLPALIPQLLVLVGLAAATGHWVRTRTETGPRLLLAWLVLVLGALVLLFHAARFPYFYMVLGLFPAVAWALLLGPLIDQLDEARARSVVRVLWIPLAVVGLAASGAMLIDTQQNQRDTVAFVDRAFPETARGFDAHGAFVCRADADPFPVRFHQTVVAEFAGERTPDRARALVEAFRSRPVSFMILPDNAGGYPREVVEFWLTRYVPYRASAYVPGRAVQGEPGDSGSFEVIVPGEYAWRPSSGDVPLEFDGQLVPPGGTVVIPEAGTRRIGLPQGGEGMIVLNVRESPAPDLRFYKGW